MIDFVKISLQGIDVNSLLNALDFKTEFKENTGEVSRKRVVEYHFCKITIYESGLVLFAGSIHKLYNSINNIKAPNFERVESYKGYNGNQFTLDNILEVRDHLASLFRCKPEQMKFQNIEFGINATTSFDPQSFIKGLLFHYAKPFEFRYNGFFSQVQHQRYFIKIYNKSNQYQMNDFTLRVELKIFKTEEIKHLGIRTFEDVNSNTLHKAYELLLRRFDEVVYYDYTLQKKNLSELQKRTALKYSNPNYWLISLNPKNRVYNRQQLKDIIQQHSDNLKEQIRQDLQKKFGIINRHYTTYQFDIINHSSIGLNNPNTPPIDKLRICPVTGVDISVQRGSSYLLSHTGLKYLYATDKAKYLEVKKKHLTQKWVGSNFNTEIREIAHNIRDSIRTQREKQARLYPINQMQLFNINL